MLARYPHTVRNEAIADFHPASIAMEQKFRWLSAHRPVPFAWQAQDPHESGAVGDATKASAEKGEQLLDHGAGAFCNCSTTSTSSIRNCFFVKYKIAIYPVTI